MMFLNIIDWCNTNQGFTDALLSLLTLIISMIAIIISIITARTPFKRRFVVSWGTLVGIENNLVGLHVTAINVGNIPVMIKNIGIKVGDDVYINSSTISESEKMLKPTEVTMQSFYKENFIIFKDLDPCMKAYAYVEDSEGRKYKKYLCNVGYIHENFLSKKNSHK